MATAFSSVVTLSLFTGVSAYREWNSFLARKEDQLGSVSRILASNSEAALSFNDPMTATEYLMSLSQERDIARASLFTADGENFANYNRGAETAEAVELLAAPDYLGVRLRDARLSFATPVEVDGERIGTLLLEADTRSLRADQLRSVATSLGLLFAGLGLASFIAYRIQKYVTHPLVELTSLARSVSRDKDYSKRAEKRYDDEIGSLVEGFNFMMESVHERDEEIQSYSRNLEFEVASRTSALQQAVLAAEQASQAKSDFLSTMSHELRTPMNAIVGMTSLMLGSEMEGEMRDHLEIVRSSSDNLLGLINDVLDYSKIESGSLELEAEEFDLVGCMEDAMDLVSVQSRDTERVFVTSIDPSLPGIIVGDVTRLRQVVINLLSNAAKFTKKGHVLLEVKRLAGERMRVSIKDTGIGIPADRMDRLFKSFSQVDSSTTRKYGGTGLGLAISQRLATAMGGAIKVETEVDVGTTFYFEIPIKCDASTLRAGEGKLSAVVTLGDFESPLKESLEGIIDAWSQHIDREKSPPSVGIYSAIGNTIDEAVEMAKRVQSAPGYNTRSVLIAHSEHASAIGEIDGSRVLALPVRISNLRRALLSAAQLEGSDKRCAVKKKKPAAQAPRNDLRILLAEDNKVNQRVFKLIMKREGYAVDIADNGQQAFDIISKQPYDVVFMDLQMPVMGGIESCKEIRALGDQISQPWIIGFTANVEADALPAMKAVGMNDFLPKPVKNTDVRKKLNGFFEQKEYEDVGK